MTTTAMLEPRGPAPQGCNGIGRHKHAAPRLYAFRLCRSTCRVLCSAQELAKVQVSKEDVKVVAHEFDLDLKAADAKLREHDGDLRSALVSLVNDGLDSEC